MRPANAQAGVAERYTRRSQKPLPDRACGFESHRRHLPNISRYVLLLEQASKRPLTEQTLITRRLTINVPDEAFESLRSLAESLQRTPEEIASSTVAERFGPGAPSTIATQEQQARSALLSVMRIRGHLVDPKTLPPHSNMADLPAEGSRERTTLEEDIFDELSASLEQSGFAILDLIERR